MPEQEQDPLDAVLEQHIAGKDVEKTFDKIEASEPEAEATPEPVEEPVADATPEETPTEETETEEPAKDEPQEEESEFGYSKGDEDEASKDDGFDEDAFDKETAKLSEGMDEKAGDKWKSLRSDLKQAKQSTKELDAVRAELAEAKEKALQVEAMQERMDLITNESYEVKVKTSPEFQAKYTEPVKAVGATLDNIADVYKIPTDILLKALHEPNDIARDDMLAKFFPEENEDGDPLPRNARYLASVSSKIDAAATAYGKAVKDRDKLFENAKGQYDEIEAARAQESVKAQETAIKQRRAHLDDLRSKLGTSLDAFSDDGKYSAAVDKEIKAVSAANVAEMSERDTAYALFAGATLPSLIAENKRLMKALGEKKAQDTKSKAASPNISSGTAQPDKTGDGDSTTFDSLLEAAF